MIKINAISSNFIRRAGLLLLYFSAVFTKSFAQERTIGGGEALYSNFLRFKLLNSSSSSSSSSLLFVMAAHEREEPVEPYSRAAAK
jgi:hypothetical protein